MLYLGLEITGWEHIRITDIETAEYIDSRMQEILSSVSFTASNRDQEIFFFERESEEVDVSGILNALNDLTSLFQEMESKMQGYNILIDLLPYPRAQAFAQMKKQIYTTLQDKACYIGKTGRGFFKRYFTLVQEGDVYKIIEESIEPGSRETENKGDSIYLRSAFVDLIAETLMPAEASEKQPSSVLVCGKPSSGGSYCLIKALNRISGRDEQGLWLYLYSTAEDPSPLHPLINSIDPEFLKQVPNYLCDKDKISWQNREEVLNLLCPDHFYEDFIQLYGLYLSAYLKQMRERGFPALLIYEDYDFFHPETFNIIARLIKANPELKALVRIIISEKESLPDEVIGRSGKILAIPPVTEAEVREYCIKVFADSKAEDLARGTEGMDFSQLLLYLYLIAKGSFLALPKEKEILLPAVLNEFSQKKRRILYLVLLSQGLLSFPELHQYLKTEGIDEISRKELFSEFSALGILRLRNYPLISTDNLKDYLERGLGQEAEEISKQFGDYLFGLWSSGSCKRGKALFDYYRNRRDKNRSGLMFFSLLSRMIDEGSLETAAKYIKEWIPDKTILPDLDSPVHPLLLRIYTLQGETEKAEKLLFPEGKGKWNESFWAGEVQLESSRFYLSGHKMKEALISAKDSLVIAQGRGNKGLESRANLAIGLVMLLQGKYEEAQEYFMLARESAEQANASFEYLKALTFEAVALIIYGNLSKALRQIELALEYNQKAARRDWQIYLYLLKGRCFFELGFYGKAKAVFETALPLCDLYAHKERKKIFHAWAARADLYGGGEDSLRLLKSQIKDSEVLFFMAESYIFGDNYDRAFQLLNTAYNSDKSGLPLIPGEVVSWENGFSSLEDMGIYIPEGRGFLYHIIRAYRGYAIGCLGKTQEGLEELSRITREDKVSENDPYNHLYYLFYSLILPHKQQAEDVDKMTILSKALKYIQQRASRIDEVMDKQAYLGRSYWNIRLMEEARRNKLI